MRERLCMASVFTDEQIAALIAEPKEAVDHVALLAAVHRKTSEKDSHKRAAVDVAGDAGSSFRVTVRQSSLDPLNFSAILSVVGSTGQIINLRRHNGPTHPHRNHIEGSAFDDEFHVHSATERYQLRGYDIEHFAEPTGRFGDLTAALVCLLNDCGFRPQAQATLM